MHHPVTVAMPTNLLIAKPVQLEEEALRFAQ